MTHKVAQPPFRIEERKKLGTAYRIVWVGDYHSREMALAQWRGILAHGVAVTRIYEPNGTHVLVLLGRDRTVA